MTLILPRRSFLLGLGASLAMPAVVSAGNIMPVRTPSILRMPAPVMVIWAGIDDIVRVTGICEFNLGAGATVIGHAIKSNMQFQFATSHPTAGLLRPGDLVQLRGFGEFGASERGPGDLRRLDAQRWP